MTLAPSPMNAPAPTRTRPPRQAHGQTWTAPQLVAWLARERGVQVSTSRLRALLRQHAFRWKRTKRSLRHLRKDPNLQAEKEADLELLHSCRASPQRD